MTNYENLQQEIAEIEKDVTLGAPLTVQLVEKYCDLTCMGKYQALNTLKSIRLRQQLNQATTVQELKAVVGEMLSQLQGR